jgi:hypothetical protein
MKGNKHLKTAFPNILFRGLRLVSSLRPCSRKCSVAGFISQS